MSDPNKIVKTSRDVIGGKLLDALEDKNTVAVLLSKNDLEGLIEALDSYCRESSYAHINMERLNDSIKQLQKEAFG